MALFYASCDKDDDGEREKRLGLVDVNVDPEIMVGGRELCVGGKVT